MPSVDIIVDVPVFDSVRIRQLSGMFDVPIQDKLSRRWEASIPIEEEDWKIDLIVGPSGSGKTIVGRELFNDKIDKKFEWSETKSVVDSFSKDESIKNITEVCSAVGFNTIPSWMKPFRVLSNGEQFRVDLARRLLEMESPVVVDEFTSVVDRQVAKIAANAVQKFIRRSSKQFVAISCHDDIIDWLQPDWVFKTDECSFHRRRLRRKPEIKGTIRRVNYKLWKIFAPYHYMNADLNKSARCYCLFINDTPVSFVGLIPTPISTGIDKGKSIVSVSRVVTIPDYQGLGLAFVLMNNLAAMTKAMDKRFRTYPAHPSLVRSFQRSKEWKQIEKFGSLRAKNTKTQGFTPNSQGGRPNAVFEWIGPKYKDKDTAFNVLHSTLHR